MKAVGFGDNCIDFYRNLDRYYVTGNVIDFAANIKLLGLDTSVVTVVGNDAYGKEMIAELARLGINVDHIKVMEGKTAFVEMDLIDGERVYRSFDEGVMEQAEFSAEDVRFVKEHDLVHFGFWGHAEKYIEEIHNAGCITSFDFATEGGSEMVKKVAPHIDYAFFSFEKLDEDAETFLKRMVELGAGCAVGTFGKEGSLVWDGETLWKGDIVPAEVVNTVGAGDSFIAGFMYGIAMGKTMKECLGFGAKTASKVISKFNPW